MNFWAWGDQTAVAEQSTGFNTKQILGYMWPIPLLKKNGKEVPKGPKLQTIQHMGKPVKGMILEEWTLGASKKTIADPLWIYDCNYDYD